MKRAWILAAALSVSALPAVGAAQQPAGPTPGSKCVLDFEGSGKTRSQLVRLPSGKYNAFVGGGAVWTCRGQDATLKSDSAEYYGDQEVLYLISDVHYREPRVSVDSRRMTYYKADERILAEGDVHAVLPSGTTMDGPSAEYFRIAPGIRPQTRLNAVGRPRMTLIERDSLGRPSPPVGLIANQIVVEADSLVFAGGKVEVTRTDVEARADSAYLDNGHGFARLMRTPSIRGKQSRPFTLTGSVIDLFSKERQLQRVVSSGTARAVSQDVNLASDTIDLRVATNLLQRAFAWGPSRARATSPERDIIADSIDVTMPDQRVREVHAVRKAFAQTTPDTVRVKSKERDWMRGDTIVARFDSIASGDTVRRPRVRELVAAGNATSFYQIAPRDKTQPRPAMNYVRGRMITVAFRNRQVNTVTVMDKAVGLYLEPGTDSTRARSPRDTTTRPPATSTGPARRRTP